MPGLNGRKAHPDGLSKPPAGWLGWPGTKTEAGKTSPIPVFKTYDAHSRKDILYRWKGTILHQIWQTACFFTLLALIFFGVYMATLPQEAEDIEELDCEDESACRPTWFNKHMPTIKAIEDDLTKLTTFVLTFFLGQSYARFKDFYWRCRNVQGKVNDVAMIIGANMEHEILKSDPEAREWADTLERYLNLANFLCLAKQSPVLAEKCKKFLICDDEGKTTILLNNEIMGLKLVTPEEYAGLQRAQNIGGPNGPVNAVLVWIIMLYDKGVNTPGKSYFRDYKDEGRMTALNFQFQTKIEELRGAIATIGFELQLPVPLAYAHMMQFFVDVVCIIRPFVAVYTINTLIIENIGYESFVDLQDGKNKTASEWNSLPLTLLGVLFFTFYYQGLLALSKTFTKPSGYEVDLPKGVTEKSDASVVDVQDKAFYLEIRTILNQVRMGTYVFFNAPLAEDFSTTAP